MSEIPGTNNNVMYADCLDMAHDFAIRYQTAGISMPIMEFISLYLSAGKEEQVAICEHIAAHRITKGGA